MLEAIEVRALRDRPRKNIFCGRGKYLTLNKLRVDGPMFPVLEDSSYFLLIREGRGILSVNGVDFAVERGCVAWIQCTQVLTVIPDAHSPLVLWSLAYDYQLSNFLSFSKSSSSFIERTNVTCGSPIISSGSASAQRLWEIFDSFDLIDALRDNGTALMKVSLLGKLSVLFSLENRSGESCDSPEYPLGWRGCIFIASHSPDTDVKDAAKALCTDIPSLNRQLRLVTGMNFEQMMNRCRCILAASYFLCQNLPFSYIAKQSGFKSEASFFRCFKDTMGMTPGEYRDSCLQSGKGGVYRGMIMDDRLISLMSYLYKNYSEPLDLNSISQSTFISKSIIRELFESSFGMSCKDVLALFRVSYSEALISSTELPLVDISALVGFNSVRTFSRAFTAVNRQTPNEFRSSCAERRLGNGPEER